MSNKAKNPVISLFGVFGAGNLGNECTLQALLYNLREHLPGATINCICTGAGEVTATYGIDAIPIYKDDRKTKGPARSKIFRILRKIVVGIPTELFRWWRAVQVMRGSDMLVFVGTGML